jgi:hypothetical protein
VTEPGRGLNAVDHLDVAGPVACPVAQRIQSGRSRSGGLLGVGRRLRWHPRPSPSPWSCSD